MLFNAIERMFNTTTASGRGLMTLRRLVVFEHDDAYGRCQPEMLFRALEARRTDLNEEFGPVLSRSPLSAATTISDYAIRLNAEHLKTISGVKVIRDYDGGEFTKPNLF